MSKIMSVAGASLEIEERGSGRPLLFLHAGDGLAPERPWLDLLARRYRVIAPSHPGWGNSPLIDPVATVDDLAYLYLDLAEALDLHNAVLIGFSLGGWIAAEIAIRCTHRFAKLVLVGPVGIKIGDRETRDIPDIFATAPDQVARLTFHDPAKAAVDYASLSDEELQILVRNREALALYTWEPYMHNPKLRHHLDRIRIPTMLIRGDSDGLVSQAYVQAYAGLIPDARLELIGEAGHAPQVEQPEEFVRRVIAFIRQ